MNNKGAESRKTDVSPNARPYQRRYLGGGKAQARATLRLEVDIEMGKLMQRGGAGYMEQEDEEAWKPRQRETAMDKEHAAAMGSGASLATVSATVSDFSSFFSPFETAERSRVKAKGKGGVP